METLNEEGEDPRNRSMRPTLTFLVIILESEQSNAWQDYSKNLVKLLAQKLDLDHFELDLQVNKAHCSPKSDFNKGCRPIYAQLFNWCYADDIQRR